MTNLPFRLAVASLVSTLLAALLLYAFPVKGEEHHPPQDQALHEKFYSKWDRPDMRNPDGSRYASCCNKQDCSPTPIKRVGVWWVAVMPNGEELPIPNNILEQNMPDVQESPDGQSHACVMAGKVICATLGSGT